MIKKGTKNMATMNQKRQAFIRHYLQVTGKTEFDMHDVANLASKMGWKLPTPPTALEILAKQFSEAAREETRQDGKTGRPYRVYHAYPIGGGQGMLWGDIDKISRPKMHKSAVMRREQSVGDMLQLTLDLEHWNRINSKEEPIILPNDLAPDVDWRLKAMGGGDTEAA